MVRRRADRHGPRRWSGLALPTDTSAVPGDAGVEHDARPPAPCRPPPGQCSEVGAQQHRLVSAGGRRPARRRSSAARVAPTKAASARPRPSSSATSATSTAEAQGVPSVCRRPRSSRHPEAATAASSFAARSPSSSSATPWTPRRSTTCAAASRSATCSGERRTSISPRRGRQDRGPLVAQGAPQHLARRRPRDGVDQDDAAQPLVGRPTASATSRSRSSVVTSEPACELHGGHRHLAGPHVGHAEHGAVDHGGVAVQDGLDLARGRPGSHSP